MFGGTTGYFNNQSLRKLVLGFGDLFNNIRVTKPDSTTQYKVPLTYSPKEKFIRRIQEPSTISEVTRTRITLPRMGFEIIGLNYDPTRKRNKLTKTVAPDPDDPTKVDFAYAEVPYLVNFGLYSFCRTIEENLQIVEQIASHFTPEFIITLNMTPVNKKVDIPIILTSIGLAELYEGGFEDTRTVTTTFSFMAKSYIFGPVDSEKAVQEPQINPDNSFFEDF
tara:strand:- start:2490 stop:3155 length:666 start_codon:yes stop_codon:yes gene_type:complete